MIPQTSTRRIRCSHRHRRRQEHTRKKRGPCRILFTPVNHHVRNDHRLLRARLYIGAVSAVACVVCFVLISCWACFAYRRLERSSNAFRRDVLREPPLPHKHLGETHGSCWRRRRRGIAAARCVSRRMRKTCDSIPLLCVTGGRVAQIPQASTRRICSRRNR